MKKSSIFSVISVAILAIFINLFSINLANAAAQDIFVAYVSVKNDDEFVFLYNSGEDFRVDSLSLVRDTKEEVAKIENGIFKGKSFLKISLSGSKIPQSSKFNLKINSENLPGFCTTTMRDCGISGLKDEEILVNNKLSGEEKFSKISRDEFVVIEKNLTDGWIEIPPELPQNPPVENPTDDETSPENPQPPAENPENPETPETPTPPKDDCRNFRITEILANSGEQFIEIENFSNEISNLKGCVLMSSAFSSKNHIFDELEIEPMKFFVLKISESSLKLNKTTKGEISLINSENLPIQSVKFEPLKAESSWAFFKEGWKQTFEITPGEENVFPCGAGYERDSNTSECVKIKLPEEEKKCAEGYFLNPESGRCKKLEEPKVQAECAAGYFRNPETGRCKKVEVEDLPTPCASGYYRNPETGRCRKIASLASTTLTPCKEGYYRHPETNRCRKIASETEELTPCKEGYERNPETNRCRKIVKNLAAEEKIETSDDQRKSEFTGWWAVFGVVFVLILVALWEFRKSILVFFKKAKK